MSDVLTYEKSEQGGKVVYNLKGVINEEADLSFMADIPAGEVIINSSEVERINSCGVREWITALKGVTSDAKISYTECSPAFLDQINMISNFIGNGEVVSMYIPYLCESCDTKKDVLIKLSECLVDDELELPEEECVECSDPMELGDDPEQLFSFLE
jgi:anti-anti-sigma regulatory factor